MTPAWAQLLQVAQGEAHAFRQALADPAAAQQHVLTTILTRNAETGFGRQHDFAAVRSWQDYQHAVPVRSYDGLRPWIDQVVAGAENVLTADPVIAWEETGGSSGGAKLIAYTAHSLKAFRAAVLPSLADLVRQRPRVAEGPLYAAISPAARQPRLMAHGIPLGLPDAAYLGEDVIPAFASLLAVPPDVAALTSVGDWQAATLRHLRATPDLRLVSVWSPTFWLELIRGLSPAEVRRLWPGLDTISCWTHGASALFIATLREAVPGVHIAAKGLLATESPMTVAWGDGGACVPALTSAFLEAVDASGTLRLLHQLEPGETARIIITTPGGLYRYDTGDRVTCTARRGRVPHLVFQGRAGVTSDMVGEKLEEGFVSSALAGLPQAARLVARTLPSPGYELWVDCATAAEAEAAARAVEGRLCCNPQYDYACRMGQLAPLRGMAKPGFWLSFAGDRRRLGVVKPSVLQPLAIPDA
jgi:hypothetical protein